ncbi:MAG TPA: hypothetical protein VMB05_08815 [Solirubrobacteraceae bacterium]|nr:hypothetical protein [Solirubrobacteraceae bacterium]
MLVVGLVACALIALAGSAAATPKRYVLRHPKHEHCRKHYKRRVVRVKRRVHGHTKKVRETVCVRIFSKPVPKPAPAAVAVPAPVPPVPTFSPAPATTPSADGGSSREPGHVRRPAASPKCTSTFTGATSESWDVAANWSDGVPSGFASYGCVAAEYPGTVVFGSDGASMEIGGVSAENDEGLALQGGGLTLSNPEQPSLIDDIKPGAGALTLGEGVLLELTGASGEIGEASLNGPGTIEIPHGAFLRTGDCAEWEGRRETKCVEGAPSPSHAGLQVENRGTILGAGIALCRDGAPKPARLENEGSLRLKGSGSFDGGPGCSEGGAVVNGENGRIGIAQLDGKGCDVRVRLASLANQGSVRIGSCFTPESAEVHRAILEIGSSLSEAGSIFDGGIVRIQGNYAPGTGSNLTVGVKQTYPAGSLETNFGKIEVSGNATLAGELNIETAPKLDPAVGQTFQIVSAGSLSGEFVLGEHCLVAEPGNGFKVNYEPSSGTVTLEVAQVPGC